VLFHGQEYLWGTSGRSWNGTALQSSQSDMIKNFAGRCGSETIAETKCHYVDLIILCNYLSRTSVEQMCRSKGLGASLRWWGGWKSLRSRNWPRYLELDLVEVSTYVIIELIGL
jgi:hypothetical protein